jgi:hypothetical protein
MAQTPEQPTTRRLAFEEKRAFQRVFQAAVARGNEGEFRLILRQWRIEPGSSAWTWAWEQWSVEREAEREALRQRASKRAASRRAPRK